MTKNWVARFFGLGHLDFLRHSMRVCTAKVFSRKDLGRRLREKKARIYGVGEASAGDSVVEAGLVASVVVGGLVAAGLAAGSVVSVFCSHAARSAALARMQIYFFIILIGNPILLQLINRGKALF